ncbi:uncharacterized protein A1O9_02131 [Exophiala aquamarina CBS 119918]|uniref:Uncharacterized protein n=1 Tax=Exophiala aquamarina CBS 119918 TaxID=1182545 RepID=A0A072PY72_9EURO|nr:uncharacterized protein A1O9_02131 [Exophiala aquamarina CBS 119918]KEF60570.1 hypothetical protein A1O9_02131 [Exophiala aquamarina CBS 119918]
MFGSNALSLPPTFHHEHRPLRLTSESARPQPTGECRYLLQHPSAQNQQRCSCQSFHHNRSAPGNICECGHQACYHVHETNKDKSSPEISATLVEKLNCLMEKVKRMEETIQNERRSRESTMHRERQLWESEVRILREALAPFYKHDEEMRHKVTDIEDRVEGNYDEQVRLRDRLVAVDDMAMTLEKRVEELEGQRPKKRRVNRAQGPEEQLPNGHISSDNSGRRVSSSIDERSIHTPSSRALSPLTNASAPPHTEMEEARSSGILNLVELPRSMPFNFPPRLSPPQDEARSSGFLNLNLADRLAQKAASERGLDAAQRAIQTPPQDRPSPPASVYARSDPEIARASYTPPAVMQPSKLPLVDIMVLPPINTSPRKRKHFDHIALDVLADVSVASPLIH